MRTLIHHLRIAAALMWLVLPPVLLSALFHMADPDINGWQGLASYSAMWSVAFVGVLAFPFFILCLVVFLDSGWSAFLATTGLFSLCVGLVLMIFGSGASTLAGHLRTLAGCTGITVLFVLLAVLPAVALAWPQALREMHGETHA